MRRVVPVSHAAALESARYLFNSFPEGSIPADYTPEMYLVVRPSIFPLFVHEADALGLILQERARLQDAEFRRVQPLKGAETLIAKLKEAKTPMAVATGSSLESMAIKTVRARAGLTDFPAVTLTDGRDIQTHLPHLFDHFDPHVLTASSAPIPPATERMKGKPNPGPSAHQSPAALYLSELTSYDSADIFLAAARSLGFPVGINEEPANEEERLWRSRGIVFEDALPGVEAGIRAGMNGESACFADLQSQIGPKS